MNVLVVGSGGREHALAWKLTQSPQLGELHAAPGNPGIARLARCHSVAPTDAGALGAVAREHAIDLVVVGPEAPLVAGVADHLRQAGMAVFGPSTAAARIEGSKAFAKSVLRSAGVPTAVDLDEPRAPCVVKADGLAAGKGVFVCRTQAEADAAWARARELGPHVVVEELLEGEEVSVFALCDGRDALPRATRSGSPTATEARTPAAWARIRPCRTWTTRPPRSSPTGFTALCSPSSRAAERPSSGFSTRA
jgi:phosphoribosylamine--glycine ligase